VGGNNFNYAAGYTLVVCFSKDSFATLPLACVDLIIQIKEVMNRGQNGIFGNEVTIANYEARK
jgi:hypothetical protein